MKARLFILENWEANRIHKGKQANSLRIIEANTTLLMCLSIENNKHKAVGVGAGDIAGPRRYISATIQELCRGGARKQCNVFIQ